MKKAYILVVVLALASALALSACDSTDSASAMGTDTDVLGQETSGDGVAEIVEVDETEEPVDFGDQEDEVTTGECDAVLGTGCEEGQRCVIDFDDGLAKCSSQPTGELLTVGDACDTSGTDYCEPGSQCVQVDGVETCREICVLSDLTCPADGENCIITAPTGVDSVYGFCGALEPCDLLEQTGCSTTQTCVGGTDPQLGFIITCIRAGEGEQGDACNGENLCGHGYACITLGDKQQCSLYCNEFEDDACPEGSSCIDGESLGFVDEYEHVGLCI